MTHGCHLYVLGSDLDPDLFDGGVSVIVKIRCPLALSLANRSSQSSFILTTNLTLPQIYDQRQLCCHLLTAISTASSTPRIHVTALSPMRSLYCDHYHCAWHPLADPAATERACKGKSRQNTRTNKEITSKCAHPTLAYTYRPEIWHVTASRYLDRILYCRNNLLPIHLQRCLELTKAFKQQRNRYK